MATQLTAAQLSTLKAAIQAETGTVPAGQVWTNTFAGVQVKNVFLTNTSSANDTIAGWYNQTAAGPWVVWRDLPMETVLGLITYASMTPADAVPTTPDLDVQVWKARALSCQGKQFNLQNLTLGRAAAPMKRTNYRAAMQDCLTNLPAGASGALIAANWTGVRDAAKFNATYGEKALSTGTGTTATPADLGFEGKLTADDIDAARTAA